MADIQRPDAYSLPELVFGAPSVNQRLMALVNETKHEVSTFAPSAAHTTGEIWATQSRNEVMYDRGIRSRTIYIANARKDGPTLAHVRWLNERGSEVRTVPTLPTRMIIVDRALAVLPLDPQSGMRGIAIHRDPSVILLLQALFDITWASASPLGLTLPKGGEALSREDRAILELLALGKTDEAISERTGLAKRTLGRRIAALMSQLNAETRFQAAYQAVKRNWL